MWMPRLILLPLLLAGAACTSAPASGKAEPAAAGRSEQPVEVAMAEKCRATVDGHRNASVPGEPRAARMRDDWVQVDGIVEWRGDGGGVARNAWTCDMFRGDDGVPVYEMMQGS